MEGKVAVLGGTDFVMAFSALGLDIFAVEADPQAVAQTAAEILRQPLCLGGRGGKCRPDGPAGIRPYDPAGVALCGDCSVFDRIRAVMRPSLWAGCSGWRRESISCRRDDARPR